VKLESLNPCTVGFKDYVLEKLLKFRVPVLIGYDDDVIGRSKRARIWGVSCLTFLPNSWWEYLD
jgi:hypothetical protein